MFSVDTLTHFQPKGSMVNKVERVSMASRIKFKCQSRQLIRQKPDVWTDVIVSPSSQSRYV